MTEHEGFHFSVVEAAILEAIDHVGWYAYLWFPVVYREVLNFPLEAPDEQVHAAFGSLIRKGALQVTPSKGRNSAVGRGSWCFRSRKKCFEFESGFARGA